MNNEAIQKILENRPAMIALILVTVPVVVASIAAGFLMTYRLVTLIGAS
jgi:hypothetical protein